MNIFENCELNNEKPAVLKIKDTAKSNTIAIGLKKDQVLKKHVTPFPALLFVISGSIAFDMEGTTTELNYGDTFEIPVNVPHEVTGLEESIFVVVKEK